MPGVGFVHASAVLCQTRGLPRFCVVPDLPFQLHLLPTCSQRAERCYCAFLLLMLRLPQRHGCAACHAAVAETVLLWRCPLSAAACIVSQLSDGARGNDQSTDQIACLFRGKPAAQVGLPTSSPSPLCTAADLVVGYMGVPYQGGDMTSHLQYMTVRNERGREMLDAGWSQ